MTTKGLTTLVKKVDFPVYGLDFTVNDDIVAVGGGGSGRSGVKNKLIAFAVNAAQGEFTELGSLTLPEDQDCPMSVGCNPVEPTFATGINESEDKIKRGENPACKIYSLESGKIQLINCSSASTSRNLKDYQKVARFSPQGRYLVAGCTDGRVTVFKMPEMTLCFPPVRFNGIQDCDIDPDERYVAVATAKALIILALEDGTIVQVIDSPRLNKQVACEFRSCRYSIGRPGNSHKLFAAVNPVTRGKGFICVWNIPNRTNRYPISRAKTASVCRKGITSFCLSPSGDLLAYASTDLTIGLLDAKTLTPILRVKEAHGFAITSLVFSRSGKFLASAGADTQCRIMIMPDTLQTGPDYSELLFAMLSLPLLIMLIHIIVQLIG